jgi:hypothetical protein
LVADNNEQGLIYKVKSPIIIRAKPSTNIHMLISGRLLRNASGMSSCTVTYYMTPPEKAKVHGSIISRKLEMAKDNEAAIGSTNPLSTP